jgi:DNA-binding transcriptional LysR family regulator
MTLKQLEAFYWAATCMNFSVAAERVNVSLSSLSKRIAELEASLGVQLFDRSGRTALLTERGEQLLPDVRQMLHFAANLRASAGSKVVGLQGRCRLGISELAGLTWLSRLMQTAAELHPGLVIEPQVDIGQVLEQRVQDGELDCVVIGGSSSRPELTSEKVGQVDFVWVASEPFLQRAGTDRPQRLVEEQTLISLPVGGGGTRVLDQWMTARGLVLRHRLACNSWGAVVGMVVEGLGFTYMPRHWAQALVQRGSLQLLKHGGSLPPLHYTVQWRRDDLRPVISEMRKMIKTTVDFSVPRCF